MATLFIFNPNATRGRLSAVAQSLQAAAGASPGSAWSMTTRPRHAVTLAADAANAGFSEVVAIGGDGTVHETVNGLMATPADRRPRLGIVPFGTGNDFALNFNVPIEPFAAMRVCLAAIAANQTRVSDVGLARDDTGRQEYWNNTLGIGFDAAVGFTTRRYAFARGFTMYLLATLDTIARNFAPTAMQIDIDGEVRAESALMLTIGNGPREGGGFNTTPASRIDDGVLEYCLARPMSRPRMLKLLPEFQRGTHGRFAKEVALGSLTRLRARWERALPIHMDGEMFADFGSPVRALEISVVPGALRVLA